MEARATLRKSEVSIASLVTIMALALGVGAAVLVIEKTSSTPAPAAAHRAAITSGPSDPGSAWNYSVRRGGTQSVEGPAAPAPYRESHGY